MAVSPTTTSLLRLVIALASAWIICEFVKRLVTNDSERL